jgi:HEPN domain-containing protein
VAAGICFPISCLGCHARRPGWYHRVGFLAQQVAEKALTGHLYGHGEEIVAGLLVEHVSDRALSEKRRFWAIRDACYVPTRDPNSVPDSIRARVYTEGAAREAVKPAAEVTRVEGTLAGRRKRDMVLWHSDGGCFFRP